MKKKFIALILAVIMTATCVGAGVGVDNADSDTVTITVNYVYERNSAMVAQPYTAQIAKGDPFNATVPVPKILNYSVPVDKAEGLRDGIKYSKDDAGNGFVKFDLASVTEDITVNLFYVAGQAKYTVNHLYQNIEDDEYGQVETVELIGDIDAYTAAVAESKPGFICTGVPEYVIAADGKTTVNIKYDRIYYTVVFDVNGGINGPKPVYGKYGAELTVSSTPTRAGYTFAGWDKTVTKTIVGNVTYKAQWIANEGNSKYAIVLWGQNANDDEYSYLDTVTATGAAGDKVTWNAGTYICDGAHTHSAACYELTCTKEEHTHSATCGLDCKHTHTAACYGGTKQENPVDGKTGSADENIAQFKNLTGGVLENGKVYRVKCDGASSTKEYDKYYLYYNNTWYLVDANNTSGNALKSSSKVNAHDHSWNWDNNKDQFWVYNAKLSCTHTHDDSCYKCGKIEHTHSALGGDCYTLTCKVPSHTHNSSCKKMGDYAPDGNLWKFARSETVTIDADGTTVLNVYFDRNEFKMTFMNSKGRKEVGSITKRWGANIAADYIAIRDKSYSSWKKSINSTSSRNYFGVMPQENQTWYGHTDGNSSATMRYFGEDLNGNYVQIFSVTGNFRGNKTDDNDLYEFEGYELNRIKSKDSMSKKIGVDNIKFYYNRNSYNLEFYSASRTTTDRAESVKYQKNLGVYYYIPANKPANMESDAIFVGWYLNPECTGEKYDLSAHSMPAANVALYAKWVNGLYTVKTFTDDSMQTLYTYDGYNGVQDSIVKYTTAPVTPTAPTKDGYVFAGWFYQDTDGSEQPFSFTMPITQDYNLYPKFTNQAMVSYTVHYYLEGTTDKLADDRTNTAMIGTTVTERAKMGTELNLAEEGHSYFPNNTSTSVVLNEADMEIIFYYKKDVTVPYVVKYVDEDNKPLHADKNVDNNTFSVVTETYVPIANYTPKQFRITKELSQDSSQNVIVFVYTADKYVLSYDTNGGTMTDASKVEYTVNDSIVIAGAPERNGYIFAGWQLAEKTGNWEAGTYNPAQHIIEGKYGNVTLVAQWNEKTAVIYYEVVGPDGCGSVSPTSETVNMVTGTANGSTATASNDAYKFVGWYSDEACKNRVSTNAEFAPTKSDTQPWPATTTYYAMFEWNVADLTINKTGAEAIDENQSFIFRVTGGGKDMYVTVQGNGSVTIKNLKVGTYTVEEVTSWSWRYEPDKAKKIVDVKGGQPNEVTFNNKRDNGSWLSGDSYAINRVGGKLDR